MKILPFGIFAIFAILIPLLTVNVFSQENYNLSLNVGNNSYYNSDSKVFGDSLYLVGYRPSSSTEALLTCFNLSSKSIQWNKESNETNNQHFTSIDVDQTGIYVGGYTTSPPGTNQKAKLLKYTHSGILIWEKTFDSDAVSKIQLLSDGSISFTLQGNNNSIGRISSTGSLFWIKKLNEISFNYSSISNSNSKILFTAVSTGTPSYIGGTGNDIVTFCSDYNGNILWSKAFGTTNDESILTSVCLENGQFLLSGMIDNPSPGLNYENLFIKIDEFGTILQTVANGTSNEDFIYDIIEDQDGNIVTAGKSYLANDAGLSLKLDNGLSVIWSKIFDGIYGELLYGVNQHESGYVLTGINQSLNGIGNFEYEIWISKLTNFGYVECLQNDVSLVPFTPVLSSLNIVLTESTVSEINVPLILISTPVDLSTSCIFECNYAIPVNAGNNQTICFGDTITLTGSGAVSYSWNAGIDNGLPFVPQMIGQNTYVLTGTDLNGCSQSDTIIISTIAPPNVNAGADQVICEGSSFTLSGTGATVYNWSDGIINAVAFQPPVGTHNYIVTGTSANGCTDIDTVTVFVTPLPVVSFTGVNTVDCSPVTFILTTTTPNALNCTWDISNGDDLIGCGSVIGTISQVGCHDVTLTTTDNNGCSNSFTAPNFICVEATPNAAFTASPSSFSQPNEQIVFTNNSSGANTYFWDFGDSSPSSNLLDPTHVYEVGVQDSFVVELIAYSTFACTDTSYLTIYYAKSSDTDVFIPTGFSPNNDGENDSWTISGLENYPNATINVFNRWGQLLFEGGPSNPTWNGMYLGELLPTADYYYIIDLGEGSKYNGVVTLKQ